MTAERPQSAPSLPRPIPGELVELIGGRLHLLALPLRIRIIDYLDLHGETNVQRLARQLDATQQNVSRHLGLLADAAVLDRRQEGRVVLYKLNGPAPLSLIESAGSQVLEEDRMYTSRVVGNGPS